LQRWECGISPKPGQLHLNSPIYTGKKIENPLKAIEWKLYGPSLEIEWILVMHNNCIFPVLK
jgi:hypothetical protein